MTSCFASFTSFLNSLLSLKGLGLKIKKMFELQSKKNKFPRTPYETCRVVWPVK